MSSIITGARREYQPYTLIINGELRIRKILAQKGLSIAENVVPWKPLKTLKAGNLQRSAANLVIIDRLLPLKSLMRSH